jgi:hypothetical protein
VLISQFPKLQQLQVLWGIGTMAPEEEATMQNKIQLAFGKMLASCRWKKRENVSQEALGCHMTCHSI